MHDLISIGSITEDFFILTDRGKIFRTPEDQLAPAWIGFEMGEKIPIDKIIKCGGGVATNLSVGTKKLGLKTIPVGPKEKAISVIIIDKKSGERFIFVEKSSGSIDLSLLKKNKSKWLSVSSLTGNFSSEAQEILNFIDTSGAKLALAPSTSMIRSGYRSMKKLMKQAEILMLNRNEAIEIAFNERIDKADIGSLFLLLHKLGPNVICITDGIKGAYCSDKLKRYYSPIRKVKTVDATGAGDAFAAGFLGFFIQGKSITKSLKAGIYNSASVVRYVGTTQGLMDKKELNLS